MNSISYSIDNINIKHIDYVPVVINSQDYYAFGAILDVRTPVTSDFWEYYTHLVRKYNLDAVSNKNTSLTIYSKSNYQLIYGNGRDWSLKSKKEM